MNLLPKTDNLHRIIYSVDASAYREKPLGVFYPSNSEDIIDILEMVRRENSTLILRGGGTSLAGQVVGRGYIADISRYMNKIIEVNPKEGWVKVEPGVILDELNIFLKKYNLFFAPETSTSNRCCIGGMVGNNSCGSHSLVYGSTRDHLLEAEVILSDGSKALFKSLSEDELQGKLKLPGLEGKIYRELYSIANDEDNKKLIDENYPHPALRRRNTGYALDELIKDPGFNLCKILAGSEGTLAVAVSLKLNVVKLPPSYKALICAHCSTLENAFKANLKALDYKPFAIELMDKNILELSKGNISQNKNRFFINGEPEAILIVELAQTTNDELLKRIECVKEGLLESGYVYHCSVVEGSAVNSVWELRKAGLGLLTSMKGDAKPVSVIEDTAVLPEYLPDYLSEMTNMLSGYGLSTVYHAHIGTGELHLRPVLNLKNQEDLRLFREVATETAKIVRKYRGSLSGEHGDGRLRGEFIPILYGPEVFELIKRVKRVFDNGAHLNRGKVVDTPPMDTSLRYLPGKKQPIFDTIFDFSSAGGFLGSIEQCNGSGDCRKSSAFKGVMCPSFQASFQEKDTTRARANLLRELLTNSHKPFSQKEIFDVLEYCVSCKGCKSECPSNIDMTKFKAEVHYQKYKRYGTPLNVWLISHMVWFQKIGSSFPSIYNWLISNKLTGSMLKLVLKFASDKRLPVLSKISLRTYASKFLNKGSYRSRLYLFADEFTNYSDVQIGISFIKLMNTLGYEVVIPKHVESGRASFSKGVLNRARMLARKNVTLLADIINDSTPLVGIEPSTILSFRDEYPDIVGQDLKEKAKRLSCNVLLYDEFIMREYNAGRISSDSFTNDKLSISLHGHCHQKALAYPEQSLKMLSIPVNYSVEMIDSGCCGMAGAFGYEKRHAYFSKMIGESRLFPQIRHKGSEVIISAPGTSCREQIKEGTGKIALHPVEIMYNALN